MLTIVTPYHRFVNPDLHGKKNHKIYFDSDQIALAVINKNFSRWKDGFTKTPVKRKTIPAIRPSGDTPELQRLFESADPKDRETFERYNTLVGGALAVKLMKIEPTLLAEIDAWLSSLSSPHTRKTYRRNIDLFFDYCKQRKILPLCIGTKQVREFIRHLRANGKTPPSVRQP